MGQGHLGAMAGMGSEIVSGKGGRMIWGAFVIGDTIVRDPLTSIQRKKGEITVPERSDISRSEIATLLRWALRCIAFEGLRLLLIPQWFRLMRAVSIGSRHFFVQRISGKGLYKIVLQQFEFGRIHHCSKRTAKFQDPFPTKRTLSLRSRNRTDKLISPSKFDGQTLITVG